MKGMRRRTPVSVLAGWLTFVLTAAAVAACAVPAYRAAYAGSKRYGEGRGPDLLAGVRAASIVTCGYPAEKGADLWEEGLKRTCRHMGMEYMGLFCRRDRGGNEPFLDEEKARAVRDFAQALRLAIQVDGL